MPFSKLDVQFLASVVDNPERVTTLNKEILSTDFDDSLYYDVYTEAIKVVLEGKKPSFSDLKFKFREDKLAIDLLNEVEKEKIVVDDLSPLYTELVDVAKRRQLKQLAQSLYHSCTNTDNPTNDLLVKAESKLLSINYHSDVKLTSVSDLGAEVMLDIDDKIKRYNKNKNVEDVIDLPTGFKTLDRYTLGLQKKNTWILAAATSDGKTQMAIQIANSILNAGKSVMYFMLEDFKQNLVHRLMSLKTGISMHTIRLGRLTDSQRNKINTTLLSMNQDNKFYVDDSTIDINEIIARTKFARMKNKKLSLVVVDHIGLAYDAGTTYGNREQELSGISKKLITLAKTCDVAVLSLAQLNTMPDDRKLGMPITPNDIRDSKAPGHDASVMLFIHYPDKRNSDKQFSKKHAQLLVGKNRYGETNKVIDMTNNAHVGKFVEGAPQELGESYGQPQTTTDSITTN